MKHWIGFYSFFRSMSMWHNNERGSRIHFIFMRAKITYLNIGKIHLQLSVESFISKYQPPTTWFSCFPVPPRHPFKLCDTFIRSGSRTTWHAPTSISSIALFYMGFMKIIYSPLTAIASPHVNRQKRLCSNPSYRPHYIDYWSSPPLLHDLFRYKYATLDRPIIDALETDEGIPTSIRSHCYGTVQGIE
jgi:hypothetical protein